ncbi:hypothetical protein CDV36_008739 [Fusarium kuroshium]|uniref:ABC transmembrane type-1 domain-containing protein n=1 Tax=Fusarium kuroshium TaxID=2010991 RepID=A0A3M2S252_9HYPO|nr:hypothetical protein CDV36_008739 [Fusarium kuroshium]
MMTANALQLDFLVAVLAYVVTALNRFCSSRRKQEQRTFTWTTITTIAFAANGALAFVGILAALRWAQSQGLSSTTSTSLPSIFGIIIGSVTSLSTVCLTRPSILQSIYELSSCVIWTISLILSPTLDWLSISIPTLYLVALITTLGAPWAPNETVYTHHPLSKAPCLPKITLSWIDPLMKLAANGTLSSDDTWPVDHNISVRHALDRPGLQPNAVRQSLLAGLGRILWRNFWGEMMLSGLLALVNVATALAQPFFLQSLLEKSDMSSVCGLFSASIIAGATDAHMRLLLCKIGVQIRSALTALLCDGCMSTPKSEESTSDPTVLIEVDSAKIFELVEQYHLLWMVPLQATISIAALILLLGWQSVLAGFLSPLVTLPLITHTTNDISRQMGLVMQAKDSRIALVTQVIKQVKQIKLGALQNLFQRKVDEQRFQELEKYKAVAFLNACMVFFVYVMPPALISMTFGTAIFLGHGLPSNVVFPALAFCFNITRAASLLPRLVMLYQGGQISFSRIREFLLTSLDEEVGLSKDATMDERPVEFGMRECDIGFPAGQDSPKVILQNCTMQATSNSLVVISGPVGCGKTTLIRSIIGEIKPHIGHVWVHGKMAYAPQIPFLICGTVRENILFGLPFDPVFYNQVLDAVSLRLDLARLPEGDATMLGGTGVALSGGQKSRVALARAVYARRGVVVLDDPLAAVDAKVRSHLIHHVLGPQGILKDSLRIVATSSQALMSYSDALYVIKNGSLSLAERPPPVHQHVTKTDQGNTSDEVESINNPSKPVINYGSIKSNAPISATIPEPDIDLESAPLLPPPTKTSPSTDIGGTPVRFDAYMRFLKLAKHGGWIIVLITAGASKLLDILAVFFLKLSSDEFERQGHSFKLAYYSACALLGGVLSAIFVLVAYYICVIPASRSIHAELTQGILEAKFSFFDMVNLGQILNRFTNDINKIDSSVSAGFISLVALCVTASASILVIVAATPLSILYLVPIGGVYFAIQSYYLHACRQLRRLETLARGPILNIANEIRVGASVIMTFDQTASFKEQARDVIDDHIRVWAPFVSLDSWLILRLQLLSRYVKNPVLG